MLVFGIYSFGGVNAELKYNDFYFEFDRNSGKLLKGFLYPEETKCITNFEDFQCFKNTNFINEIASKYDIVFRAHYFGKDKNFLKDYRGYKNLIEFGFSIENLNNDKNDKFNYKDINKLYGDFRTNYIPKLTILDSPLD